MSKHEINRHLNQKITKAREEFYTFVCLMAPSLIPDGFIQGRHIKLICDELQKVFESVPVNNRSLRKEPAKRLQIFLPPGGMKSLLASVLFPAWCYGKKPSFRCIGVGNSTEFAINNFSIPIRDILESEEYATIFPHSEIKENMRSSSGWYTTLGGTYLPAGVLKSIAGRRAHISICDDALSEQTALSNTERNKICKWYVPGLQSRLLPGGAEIIINTRWHIDDLSGARMRHDGAIYGINKQEDDKTLKKHKRPWKIIKIPAILDKDSAEMLNKGCPDFSAISEGDSYWPELWSLDDFLEKKNTGDMSEMSWSALYMQNPVPEEGSIIKKETIKWWPENDEIPVFKYIVVSVDTAFSVKETADFSAITVWGIFETKETDFRGKIFKKHNAFLLNGKRGRWAFGELTERVKEINNQYRPDINIIEQKASGQSLIQEMKFQGFPIKPYRPETDKQTRAHSASVLFESGSVFFPEGKLWVDEIVEELVTFPFSPHDDYVDTITQAMIWLRDTHYLKSKDNVYKEEYDEDDFYIPKKTKNYWGSLTSNIH